MDKLLKVLTDPVSNRILQLIRVKGEITISEIISSNIDVPRATLYRKIDKMAQAFYKEEFRVFIFTGDEINDEDFIATIDNSPTYKRSIHDLENLKNTARAIGASKAPQETPEADSPATDNNENQNIENQ